MVYSSTRADFGFKIEFIRSTEDPARVFRAFSKLIEFCEITDRALISPLELDLKTSLLLDDIKQGSIIVWLKIIFATELKELNLNNFKFYLIESKQAIINFIKDKITIESPSELLILQNKIQAIAQNKEIRNPNKLKIYTPPNEQNLLEMIDKCQSATSELQEFDKLYYLYKKESYPVNCDFRLSEEDKDNLLVKETIKNEIVMILQVKKPDYLGESKWEFKYNHRKIDAKINDLEWLKLFKERQIVIAPGDAIKARVETVSKYDLTGKVISIKYTIQQIIEVIPIPPNEQLSLLNDPPN